MSTEILGYFEIASNLPPAAAVTFHDVSWEEYEQLIEELGEARGLRVSYNEGTLEIMTVSSAHESYATFINRLISHLSFRLRINIRFFGSATMRTRKKKKGRRAWNRFTPRALVQKIMPRSRKYGHGSTVIVRSTSCWRT